MTDVLLNALVPIFAVMGLGYFAGWIRDVDNHHVAELNALVMDFAVPAALFVATASASRHMLLTQWPLLLALVIPMLGVYALSYWMERRLFGLRPAPASVQALTVAFPNFRCRAAAHCGGVRSIASDRCRVGTRPGRRHSRAADSGGARNEQVCGSGAG
jgi:predicted permease